MRPTMGQIKTNVGPSFDYLNSVICSKLRSFDKKLLYYNACQTSCNYKRGHYVCLLSAYPPTSFICNLHCIPRFQTKAMQCRHQTWSSQPQTELVYAAIIRCYVLGYSCTVSPLSTVMWNSVDIGQRIIYSWICQNCTSQHLAIPSASTPPRLLYKQGAVVSPVSLQTFAKILFINIYYLIYVYISTWLLGFVQIYFS